MKVARFVGSGLVAALACASGGSAERLSYILAHAHGFVEISIRDAGIPDVPVERDKKTLLERPGSCFVTVQLDREEFVSDYGFPVGDQPPYSVATGFRFPAPVGSPLLRLSYVGCSMADGKESATVLELPITVQENRVSEIHFDGAALSADAPRVNPVVTLEDVYQAVTGKRSALPQ